MGTSGQRLNASANEKGNRHLFISLFDERNELRKNFGDLITQYPVLFQPEFLLLELCLILNHGSVEAMQAVFLPRMEKLVTLTNEMFLFQQATKIKNLGGNKRKVFESIKVQQVDTYVFNTKFPLLVLNPTNIGIFVADRWVLVGMKPNVTEELGLLYWLAACYALNLESPNGDKEALQFYYGVAGGKHTLKNKALLGLLDSTLTNQS